MDQVFVFAGFAAAVKLTFCYLNWNKVPKRAEFVGRVAGLTLYPVKSMKGVKLDHAECTHTGLKLPDSGVQDRCWMVTTGDNNRFVTARQEPSLLLVQPTVHENSEIVFNAPSMETLRLPLIPTSTQVEQTKVWGEAIEARDCGDEAAAWITRYLGNKAPHRLLYHNTQDSTIRARSAWSQSRKPMIESDVVKTSDKLIFHDDGPFLLTTLASLNDLNDRLPEAAVPMETFRPTIIISSDLKAFDEDNWREIFIGDKSSCQTVKFTTMMPCSRCMLTTFDATDGSKRPNNEPVNTLNSYRRILTSTQSPCFGTYLVCDRPGSISVNDPVYILRKTE